MDSLLYIAKEDITGWLAALMEKYEVLAPRNDKGEILYAPLQDPAEYVPGREAVNTFKRAMFRQTQELFRYGLAKDPEHPEDVEVNRDAVYNHTPTVVFGARPCGVAGILTFDPVFDNERISDPYYTVRRENTFFITLACDDPASTCFCHWVGGAPDQEHGTDVMLYPVGGGYAARAVSDKGGELLGLARTSDGGDKAEEANAGVARARSYLNETPAPDLSGIAPALEKVFMDVDFWEDMTAACVSCGACTYLCPTCYCFNITDESDGLAGVRIRTWDSCMFHQYTQEASGHNPRPAKAHRMRNRVGHKYWYHPANHGGTISCTGCGRCIRHCPGDMDIRKIITKAMERADAQQ